MKIPITLVLFQFSSWPLRRWAAAVAVGLVVALATGLPTDIVPNSFYRRMTPVTWWGYLIWAGTAVLFGLIAATYVGVGSKLRSSGRTGRILSSGLLSFLAVGCPICNKLVVAALGVSGALTYFGPIQPFLGLVAIMLLAGGLAVRLRGLAACRVRSPSRAEATKAVG